MANVNSDQLTRAQEAKARARARLEDNNDYEEDSGLLLDSVEKQATLESPREL